jgi:hypothetical protein
MIWCIVDYTASRKIDKKDYRIKKKKKNIIKSKLKIEFDHSYEVLNRKN